MTTKLLLLGAGNIGTAIAEMLGRSGDYALTIADRDLALADRVSNGVYATLAIDARDPVSLSAGLMGFDMVISACPFFLNVDIARAAKAAHAHYFDLTEDVETTRAIRALSTDASTVFMPQCGLAPGFVSVVAHDLTKRFETLKRVRMRVGALPQFPTNAFKYNLTWSTDGLINEYCNPCEVIEDGAPMEVLPLEGYEQFSLDGISYEAFNTSGGLGTLCESLAGRVDNLDYKTIRYPGHCELIRFLVNDLALNKHRDLFKAVLENAVPTTVQDVVLVFVTVSGARKGRLTQETYAKKIYNATVGQTELSAIQITTAAGVCAMVDLVRDGTLPSRGFLKQEDVPLSTFLSNRFGKHYA